METRITVRAGSSLFSVWFPVPATWPYVPTRETDASYLAKALQLPSLTMTHVHEQIDDVLVDYDLEESLLPILQAYPKATPIVETRIWDDVRDEDMGWSDVEEEVETD